MKVFFSYCFDDTEFVRLAHKYLRAQPNMETFFFEERKIRLESWTSLVGDGLEDSIYFLLFLGKRLGDTQKEEALTFAKLVKESAKKGIRKRGKKSLDQRAIVIKLPTFCEPSPSDLLQFVSCREVTLNGNAPLTEEGPAWTERDVKEYARRTSILLTKRWVPHDDLPEGYPFHWEKHIIDAYVNRDDKYKEMVHRGGSPEWPSVEKKDWKGYKNPIHTDVIGFYRDDDAKILVDARSIYHCPATDGKEQLCLLDKKLTFSEAGPRDILRFPPSDKTHLKVGILVSGGIAPGINAVISGIVERHKLYARPKPKERRQKKIQSKYNLQVFGIRNGFAGLLAQNDVTCLYDTYQKRVACEGIANQGGSWIGTSRCDSLLSSGDLSKRSEDLDRVAEKLADIADGYDILYIIGGDGSMRAAHAVWTRTQQLKAKKPRVYKEVSIVAVPKTMDNDIPWVWQSFGFLSAVEKAKDVVRQLSTEVTSNPRLCVMQLFGSDSGFVVSHAALASGICDAALIPEVPFSMPMLFEYIKGRLKERYTPGQSSPFGMILMAETAIPTDALNFLKPERIRKKSEKKYYEVGLSPEEKEAIGKFLSEGRRVQGQTPDELRSGGLKIVSRYLKNKINDMNERYFKTFRVFTNEPRHLIRAIDPSSQDVIFGRRLGVLAVDNAMAGYTDFMISQWLTEYVLVPLKLVVLGRKRVPSGGIFWKSVVANTGQPTQLNGVKSAKRKPASARSKKTASKKNTMARKDKS